MRFNWLRSQSRDVKVVFAMFLINIMPPSQKMSHVQNISSITIIANDILYNKLVQHINADLKFKVTKDAKTLANILLVSENKSTKR